jgi:GNAT superfamily N-acetyltransferase
MSTLTLTPFDPDLAAQVLSWLTSFQESVLWCGRRQFPLAPEDLLAWHSDPDVHPYLLLQDGTPIAYGEVHVQVQEAELMRLVVAPSARGQGHAGTLINQLLATLKPGEVDAVLARITPHHQAMRHGLAKQGFRRLDPTREADLNQWEAAPFEWYGHNGAYAD